jgi:hypothetical protein
MIKGLTVVGLVVPSGKTTVMVVSAAAEADGGKRW